MASSSPVLIPGRTAAASFSSVRATTRPASRIRATCSGVLTVTPRGRRLRPTTYGAVVRRELLIPPFCPPSAPAAPASGARWWRSLLRALERQRLTGLAPRHDGESGLGDRGQEQQVAAPPNTGGQAGAEAGVVAVTDGEPTHDHQQRAECRQAGD